MPAGSLPRTAAGAVCAALALGASAIPASAAGVQVPGIEWAAATSPTPAAAAPWTPEAAAPFPSVGPGGRFAAGPASLAPESAGMIPSLNWSGVIEGLSAGPGGLPAPSGRSYNSVSGVWVVPPLLSPAAGVESTWVGLGGVLPQDGLLQVGTIEGWDGTQPSYWAFWELLTPAGALPAEPIAPVRAGDIVSASIAPSPSGEWTLSITDDGVPLPVPPPAGISIPGLAPDGAGIDVPFQATATAEWIAEDPLCSGTPSAADLCPLANFAPEQFFSATARPGNVWGGDAAYAGPWVESAILGAGGALAAIPSPGATDDSFTVTRILPGAPVAAPTVEAPVPPPPGAGA